VSCDLGNRIGPLIDELLKSRLDGGFGSLHGPTPDYKVKNQRFFDALQAVIDDEDLQKCLPPDLIRSYSLSPEAKAFLVNQLHLPLSGCACLLHALDRRTRTASEDAAVTDMFNVIYGFWGTWGGASEGGKARVHSPFRLRDDGGCEGQQLRFTTSIDNLSNFLEDCKSFVKTGVVTMNRYSQKPAGERGQRLWNDPVEPIFTEGIHSTEHVAKLVEVHLRMVHMVHFRWHSYIENGLDRQPGASHETLLNELASIPWGWDGVEEAPQRKSSRKKKQTKRTPLPSAQEKK